jgi:hypothetical protein
LLAFLDVVSFARIFSSVNPPSLAFFPPPPPHAHARLSLAREPASTELGSGERDACPSILVCFFLGALSYVVALRGIHTYTFILYCPRSPAVAGFGALLLYHRQRDPSLDPFIRRSTRDRVQLPVPSLFSVSSRLLAAISTAATFASAWSPPSKLEASVRVIAIIVHVMQLHYYSQSANFTLISTRTRSPLFARLSFIAWLTTTALYRGFLIRLLRRLVQGYQLAFCFVRESLHLGLQGPLYKQGEARDAN